MSKNIKLIRLTSGEELIGNVSIGEYADTKKIKDAIVLIPAGEGKIGFMPFMAYTKAKGGILIDRRFVVFVVEPLEELVDQIRQMETGLTVPSGKIVT